MNRFALAAILALALGGPAQAKMIELVPEPSAPAQSAATEGAGRQSAQLAILPSHPSELPEPEVFAMMLVGLVLIGYRARRDSSEKFK